MAAMGHPQNCFSGTITWRVLFFGWRQVMITIANYLQSFQKGDRHTFFSAKEAEGFENLEICLPHLLRKKVKAVDIYYHILRCKLLMLKADIADFLKCDMLVFDYVGYGVSDGESTEKSVYDSVERVYNYAIDELGYAPKDVILIGFSLGTAAMVHIASKTPELGAMVLIAPFMSLWRVILRRPDVTSSLDMFPSYDKALNIRCPTLVCHGKEDSIVDHHHGLAMKERITNCELFLIPATHQNL
ncbi:hypothetical protein NECAME_01355 [Necator americanus]|uniref:AB hydrolase-1 domain-containing protein n=1 Tax=Necator americanus TaxID=51031 RepID=W2TYW1_NECAM|nr:hypothetical protein NECAME_01355 [Necator americanus]ETN86227.1 hypothetical protein NECAME_01355 [Necator americanus]